MVENKIYEIDGKLWVGCPNKNNNIECHITSDISERYHLPNSFIYEDDDAEWYTLDTTEKLIEARVIAIGYTCIRLTDGFSETFLYAKVDAILKFFENKLNNCKSLKDFYNFFNTYGTLFLALGRKENNDGRYF